MRAVLDACVLFPTVQRELLIGAAQAGFFEPKWSPRIIEEWTRSTARLGAEAQAVAEGEAVALKLAFPRAETPVTEGLAQRLWLPDPADVHVLGAAIASSSDVIVTVNAKDFPRNVLAEEGISRADPDAFLLGFFEAQPDVMGPVAEAVRQKAEALSGEEWPVRKLMKKARLPRFGKALERSV